MVKDPGPRRTTEDGRTEDGPTPWPRITRCGHLDLPRWVVVYVSRSVCHRDIRIHEFVMRSQVPRQGSSKAVRHARRAHAWPLTCRLVARRHSRARATWVSRDRESPEGDLSRVACGSRGTRVSARAIPTMNKVNEGCFLVVTYIYPTSLRSGRAIPRCVFCVSATHYLNSVNKRRLFSHHDLLVSL